MHSIIYDPVTQLITTGSQDNGAQTQLKKDSMIWKHTLVGDGTVIAVDTLANPGSSILYTSCQFLGYLNRSTFNSKGNLIYEEQVKLINENFFPQFVTPFKVNSVVGGHLLIAGENSIFESTDKGDTLTDIGNNNPLLQNCRCISYGGRYNGIPLPSVIYACSKNKVFLRILPSDKLIETSIQFPGGDIHNIILDPNDCLRAFVVTKLSKVYMTSDAGSISWLDITGNLKNVGDLFSIEVIRNANYVHTSLGFGGIVVGTEYGLYISSGNSLGIWNKIGENIPNVQINDLCYNPESDILAVATFGRGAWVLKNVYSTLYGNINEMFEKKSSKITSNILSNLKKATNQIAFVFDKEEIKYIGSGFFYYDLGFLRCN
jgi:hypothetical protein